MFAATAVLTCTLSVASAQTATRLVDIGSSVGPVVDSKPTDFVQFGPFVYFAAEDPIAGVELWRTGGTPASTTLVADVVPDPRGSFPRSLTVAGDRLFFVATDANGTTASLYVSDGTADGTQAVFVIGQLLAFVPTAELVAIGDRVLGVTRPSGQQILLSDGTPAGTSFLAFAGPSAVFDINPAAPRFLVGPDVNGNERAWFLGRLSPAGTVDLYESDGTIPGTSPVASIPIPPSATQSSARIFARIGADRLIVGITSGLLSPTDISSVDLTTGVVTPLRTTSVFAFQWIEFDGRLVLISRNPDTRAAAATATGLVDLAVPSSTDFVRTFLGIADNALWMVGTPPTGDELRLLRLDAGSDAIVDVGPLGTRAEPAGQFGSSFVLDYQPSAGTPSALTRLDIPSLGTTILGPSPVTGAQQPVFLAPPVQLPSGIYFAARDATGIEPWVSNGTIAGTRRIADAAFLPPEAADGNPAGYAALGSRVAFRAAPQNVPQQLWSSDGTTVGTGTIADGIAQGAPLGSLLEIGGRVALRRGGDLVLVDPSGLQPEVLASSVVDDGLAFGRGVLSVLDTGAGTRTTVRVTTDGVQTPLDSSPTSLGPVEPVVVTGEYGWFRAGSRALFTDGTTTTQPPVGGSLSTFPRVVAVPFDGSVWARGSDENGSEPVRRARSSSITQLGVLGSSGDLVVVDELLYSVSATDAGNVGIRFTDGTFTGTVPSSPPCDFGVALGSQLLAVTEDDALILADQSAPIAPLHAGPIKRIPASDPVAPPRAAVYPVSRELAYFVVATSFATPDQLWQTDGTAAGTSFVQDLDVLDAAALQGSLYLTVDDGIAHGIEPFVLRPPVFNLPVGASCSGHPTGTHTLRTDVDPRVGRTVQILGRSRVDGAGSGQFAGIFLGSAGDAPVFLGPSKCAFRLDFNRPIAALTVPVGAAGDFSVALPIPQAPVFVGAELLFQALVTPSPSPIGVDITNGLLWVIGG